MSGRFFLEFPFPMTDRKIPPKPAGSAPSTPERDSAPDDRNGRPAPAANQSGRPPRSGERPPWSDGRPPRTGGRPPAGGKPGQRASGVPFNRGEAKDGGGPSTRPHGATGALIELDRELMKLLVRRASLVSRIRGGRDHAASAAAVQAEKAVRVAWETGALSFSKDPRFIRQLFTLLQDIKVMTREQSENTGSFNLSPPLRPVSGVVTGPTSARAAQMRLALAACLGRPLDMNPVMLSSPLMDCIKACSQAGASIIYDGAAYSRVRVKEGSPLSFAEKSLFTGEDAFTLHLLVFLAIGRPGVCRLSGGARLKEADLSGLRHVLPLFGARLAHVIPRSQGLPATLESSGDIPPLVVVPAEIPFESLCALLLAPLAWNVPLTLNLADLPATTATAALAEVRPLHRQAGAEVETHGSHLVFTPGPLAPPETPSLPLDPLLSAYLLALPAFAGGHFTLKGVWPSHTPEAMEAEQLLAWAGLAFRHDDAAVAVEASGTPFTMPLHCNDLSPQLGPLFLALAARRFSHAGQPFSLEGLAPFPQDETEHGLAEEFFARLGLVFKDNTLLSSSQDAPASGQTPVWTSPDACWSMAYALCSYLRPGLQLANPGNVTEAMPPFWRIFNSLPAPADPGEAREQTTEEPKGDKPARRRIIAD